MSYGKSCYGWGIFCKFVHHAKCYHDIVLIPASVFSPSPVPHCLPLWLLHQWCFNCSTSGALIIAPVALWLSHQRRFDYCTSGTLALAQRCFGYYTCSALTIAPTMIRLSHQWCLDSWTSGGASTIAAALRVSHKWHFQLLHQRSASTIAPVSLRLSH